MTDTTTIKAVEIISSKDTVAYMLDKKIVEYFTKVQSADNSHLWDFLPVASVIMTMVLTKMFEIHVENKKYKREIAKENRKDKNWYLTQLNKLKISLDKPNFFDDDIDERRSWWATKMIQPNPFEGIKIHSNILFSTNENIIKVINRLYNNAEKINNAFDWSTKEHTDESLSLADIIYKDLKIAIEAITKDLKT